MLKKLFPVGKHQKERIFKKTKHNFCDTVITLKQRIERLKVHSFPMLSHNQLIFGYLVNGRRHAHVSIKAMFKTLRIQIWIYLWQIIVENNEQNFYNFDIEKNWEMIMRWIKNHQSAHLQFNHFYLKNQYFIVEGLRPAIDYKIKKSALVNPIVSVLKQKNSYAETWYQFSFENSIGIPSKVLLRIWNGRKTYLTTSPYRSFALHDDTTSSNSPRFRLNPLP